MRTLKRGIVLLFPKYYFSEMPYQTKTNEYNKVFFCTFTCYDWQHLFHITNFYDEVYKWFNILLENKNKILGYVIMPNHLHFLIYYTQKDKTLNTTIGNGKRFMAYEIVKRLEQNNEVDLLTKLTEGVNAHDKLNGKLHQVFQLSFDHKICFSREMLETKLNYIHLNPVSKHWRLADDWRIYEHSSAQFYEIGICNKIQLTHYREIEI